FGARTINLLIIIQLVEHQHRPDSQTGSGGQRDVRRSRSVSGGPFAQVRGVVYVWVGKGSSAELYIGIIVTAVEAKYGLTRPGSSQHNSAISFNQDTVEEGVCPGAQFHDVIAWTSGDGTVDLCKGVRGREVREYGGAVGNSPGNHGSPRNPPG